MSLKTRLRLSIVALVVGIVVIMSALNLHGLASARFEDLQERATTAALQVQSLLVQRISEQSAGMQPANLEETKALWAGIVQKDEELSRLLRDTMASSQTILEIEIASETGRILASSNPSSAGAPMQRLPSLAGWQQKSPWEQLLDVFTQRLNYDVTIPLGIEGQESPVFEIQVIVSSVLLRNTLMPQVRYLAVLFAASLLASILLAMLASNVAFRPLARISEAIDRIASGEFAREASAEAKESKESKEYAAVQSKLNVLGQQFRGAKEDVVQLKGNIERLLQRLEGVVMLFDKNDRLMMAGGAADSVLGKGRWELMGQPMSELFPPATLLGAAIQGAVQFRRPLKDHPLTLERSADSPLRLIVNVEMLEDFPSRERIGTLITLRDAETRRQITSQIDVSTRLTAISRLTGGVAHEIKNPLNAIALHLEVLKARMADGNPEIEREIQIIASEITRLDRVVKTFLDFNRPIELQIRDVDLGELAKEVATLVHPEARKHSVEVLVEADRDAVVRGDPDLIKQAILNVVVNGVEAMNGGGHVKIQVQRAGDECVVTVSDNGPGIPPEIREKIFNLYFTTKGKGSGIGLAMTFRVVQLHNGTIDFSSEPGRGTTFWLRIPAGGNDPLEAAGKAQEKSEG